MNRTLMLLAVVSLPASALAAKFDTLPSGAGLQLRVVKYEGSVNGTITVEVQNPTAAAQSFDARGLYFVPQGDPDHAPQRLGAVGPFRAAANEERMQTMSLAPGGTARLQLDVYCIDSQRPAPTEETPFRVAKDRIPAPLTQAISTSAERSAAPYGGVSAPAAKSAVQSEVWRNRDSKWIKLDGEGRQEAAKH
jgi:hypothetical protein